MPRLVEPPTHPTDLAELKQAYGLCGRIQAKGPLILNMFERERLVHYCGRMPETKKEARGWRLWLRTLWREANAEGDPDAETCP